MQDRNNIQEKTQKTAQLVGVANLVTSPLLLVDLRIGITALIAVNSILLYYLHGLGKSRRPGSNALNTVSTFFAAQTNTNSNEIENTFRNIVNGGAALHDECRSIATTGQSSSYRN